MPFYRHPFCYMLSTISERLDEKPQTLATERISVVQRSAFNSTNTPHKGTSHAKDIKTQPFSDFE